MVRRVLADVLDTKIVDYKGEADVFGGMLPKGRGPSDGGVAKLSKVCIEPIVRDAAYQLADRSERMVAFGWDAA